MITVVANFAGRLGNSRTMLVHTRRDKVSYNHNPTHYTDSPGTDKDQFNGLDALGSDGKRYGVVAVQVVDGLFEGVYRGYEKDIGEPYLSIAHGQHCEAAMVKAAHDLYDSCLPVPAVTDADGDNADGAELAVADTESTCGKCGS